MSKVFARYVVAGDEEDMRAFEAIIRHIDKCIMMGANRDITISVDGDGSASLRFWRNDQGGDGLLDEELHHCKRVEYLDYPEDMRKKLFDGKEDVDLGDIGVMKADGRGHYYIGE